MALDTSNLHVLLRGADLWTKLQSTAVDQTRDEVDDTVFASAIRSMQATTQRIAMAHVGLYEDGPDTIAELLRAFQVATEEAFTVAPQGLTVGNRAFIVVAHTAGITVPDAMVPGQLVKCAVRASGRIPVPQAGVIAYNGTVAADTQTTPLQLGAATQPQQVLAVVHLLAITPAPSVVFFLESDDGVGFASATVRDTSAAQTARGSVLLKAVAPLSPSPADDWWRVRWDHSGTGSFTALIALGLAG